MAKQGPKTADGGTFGCRHSLEDRMSVSKRKPLVRILLNETVVMGGVRYCFLNNDRGRRLLAEMRMEAAMRNIKPIASIAPIKIEVQR